MDPASNNMPLQFNTGHPQPYSHGPEPDTEHRDGVVPSHVSGHPGDNTYSDMNMHDPTVGQYDMMDPSNIAMGPMGPGGFPPNGPHGMNPYEQAVYMGGMMQVMMRPKEIIKHKSCVLYPPNPNGPPPTTRERPPGCRTIFVGGLPENCTEDILSEVFSEFGNICTLRLSKKHFAHLRYELEPSVDQSLFLSGYRMKIEDKDDKPSTGRLHVDYAQARDDLYEWECKQRAMMREQRHLQRMENAKHYPSSPPPLPHFSDHEAHALTDKLKDNETFYDASNVLLQWLERGEINRRSVNHFYSMIQVVNSHVRRLMMEKDQQDQQLVELKEKFKVHMQHIINQYGQIERVFAASSKQKCWDHFSKGQRKNLDMWHKQAKEILKMQQDDFLKQREEDEMELSDTEDVQEKVPFKKLKSEDIAQAAQQWAASKGAMLSNTPTTSTSNQLEVEGLQNEIELLKQDAKAMKMSNDQQMKTLKQTLSGMKEQLMNANMEKRLLERQYNDLKTRQQQEKSSSSASEGDKSDEATAAANDTPSSSGDVTRDATSIPGQQAKIIGLVATFLHVHPFGASLDYIWSYLRRIDIAIKSSEIEAVLSSYPTVFTQDTFGVGASLEKRWKFIGFESDAIVL